MDIWVLNICTTKTKHKKYMQTIDIYWKLNKRMGNVLVERIDEQKILFCLDETKNMSRNMDKKVEKMEKALLNLGFSKSDEEINPLITVKIDTPFD